MLLLNVPLTLISVLGILFHGYTVIAVLLTRQVTTANNLLLLHLGTIEVVLGFSVLVFVIAGPVHLLEGAPCLLQGFLVTLLHPLALWTICGLNCDRYYAIAAPLHYSHIVTTKKVLLGLGAGWFTSLVLTIPPFFDVAPFIYVPGLRSCAPDFSVGVGTLWYATLYTAFTLLLPFTLISCCNLKIFMIARYHRHRIASAIYEVTLSAQVTITHQRNPFFVPTVTSPNNAGPPKLRGRSAITSIVQLLGSLLLLYAPYYTLILWETTVGGLGEIHGDVFGGAMVLLMCSLPINGFLYGVKSKPLRKTFKNYWRKKQTKSEVNQEIQARTPSTCGSRRPSLTPLGFLTRPNLQRRLSEALLDVHRVVGSPQGSKIKRVSTDITWKPSSANSLNFLPKEEGRRMKQTSSCNTLQVPEPEIATIPEDDAKKSFLGFMKEEEKSPRITITRTYSEESERKKWRPSEIVKMAAISSTTVMPLLDYSSNGSESSETSECSQIFMTLDQKSEEAEVKRRLLGPKKGQRLLKHQKSVQSHDIVLD